MALQQVPIAQTLPVADRTWEVQLYLPNNAEEAAAVEISFPQSGTLVALVITVSQSGPDTAPTALPHAGLEDVLIALESDKQHPLTKRGEKNVANSTFVTALALDSTRRLLMLPVSGPETWTVRARWKDFLAGTPYWESCLISVIPLFSFEAPGAN